MELLEDPPALLLRDADPGIPDLDAQLAVAAPAPEQDAPFRRIADRVGQQFAENALEQMRIAVDHLAGRHHAQGEAAPARLRPVDAGHTDQQLLNRQVHHESPALAQTGRASCRGGVYKYV